MKVVGFSFIRNAVKFDYPIVESITSILPLCDEFILILGDSEDSTEEVIKQINSPKIHIIPSKWDKSLHVGGIVLAEETNKAIAALPKDTTWAFYIQADEIIHEKYLPEIKAAMEQWKDDKRIDGLLFKYLHFYGSYDYIGSSRRWYRNEIRIVRPQEGLTSYKDAQGFRINDKKLRVKPIDAFVYHYGWVKSPFKQQEKQKYFHSLWHDEKWIEENVAHTSEFDYSQIDSLALFKGTHPKCMQARIEAQNWKFDFDPTKKNFGLKIKILNAIEHLTSWRIGEYKNYKII